MSLAYITHPACSEFDPGEPHPERPSRLSAINDHLVSLRLLDLATAYEAPDASEEQLLRVHGRAYLDQLAESEPRDGALRIDEDTWLVHGSLRAARRAAGAAVHAVDLVMSGKFSAAFCAVRPPGHHAERNRAMGFCLYNNVAVAAAHALAVHAVKRVAIIDFDAHWGNGTDDIFRDEKRVGVFATFQDHLFPATNAPGVPGRIHNVPLAPGTRGREIRQVYHDSVLPAVNDFRPQLLLISAGFDGHREDAMSDLEMTEDDYAWLTEQAVDIARRHAGGRVVSVLEGGYDHSSLGRSVAAHVRALIAE